MITSQSISQFKTLSRGLTAYNFLFIFIHTFLHLFGSQQVNDYFQDLQVEDGEQETESEVEEEQEQEKTSQPRATRKARVEIEYEQEREPKRAKLKA